jgi:tetratricopeptide (TPR) repeat protein
MTRDVVTLALENGGRTLVLRGPEGLFERRDVGASPPFGDWVTRYRALLRKSEAGISLLALGRDMWAFVEGAGSWLTTARGKLVGKPFVLEIQIPGADLGAVDRAFVEAPWEILADEKGFLAERDTPRFAPIRRWGEPEAPTSSPKYRLSVVFMAASPRGEVDLGYEAEEAEILRATHDVKLDLRVEDTGSLAELARLVVDETIDEPPAAPARPDVLHLTCHGVFDVKSGAAVLAFEDEAGDVDLVTAGGLADRLGANLPRLVFASACETTASDGVADSFAVGLVVRGVPAALGWSGKVGDRSATRFAADLYRRLAERNELETAASAARRELLSPSEAGVRPSADWHLARLYLGPRGGGVLSTGKTPRRRVAADVGHKEFLDKKRGLVAVASRAEFVGRRRELQKATRELRDDSSSGILLHGLGGHGKSSLAARLANRHPRLRVAVVHGRYDAEAVVTALQSAVHDAEIAHAWARERDGVRSSPDRLRYLLRDWLEKELTDEPVLLVIDDLEQVLEPTEGGLHRVRHDVLPVLRAVLHAFDGAPTASRLILTSRYRFMLPDEQGVDRTSRLFDLHLSTVDESQARKQWEALLRERAVRRTEVDDADLLRSWRSAGGNPRIQRRLFGLLDADRAAWDRVANELEDYLGGGGFPTDQEVAAFLEALTLQRLIELLSPEEAGLLSTAAMFEVPIPRGPLLAAASRAAPCPESAFDRCLGLGLLEPFEDLVDPSATAFAPTRLVRPLLSALSEVDQVAVARAIVGPLFTAWGDAQTADRSPAADAQLALLAVLGERADIVKCVAERAVWWFQLAQGARRARTVGLGAIRVLDARGEAASCGLLRQTAEVSAFVGDTPTARTLFARAAPLAEAGSWERAALLTYHGRLLVKDGDIAGAEQFLREAFDILGHLDRRGEAAVLTGDIARIHASRGEVDQALRLHRERLQVFEELGDRRERALALADIAQIERVQGAVDRALSTLREVLLVFTERGDARSRAGVLGDIASIQTSRGQIEEALLLHKERLQMFDELGDRRSHAVALGDIARIHVYRHEIDEALRLHREQLRVFEELGDRRSRAVTLGDIARIHSARGQVEDALRLHQEELVVYKELGDRHSHAVTLGDIAHILVTRGQVDAALQLHLEQLKVYSELGDQRERSVALFDVGQLEFLGGKLQVGFDHMVEAHMIARELGEVHGIAATGEALGSLLALGGRSDMARPFLQTAAAAWSKLGDSARARSLQELLVQSQLQGAPPSEGGPARPSI